MLDAELAIDAGDAGGSDGGIGLALTVRNAGDAPETLRFRTGQHADFAAYRTDRKEKADGKEGNGGGDSDGDPVWRYGTGRMFTQVLGSETLEPGESTTYEATWPDPPPGRYRFVGEVTAEERGPTATEIAEVG